MEHLSCVDLGQNFEGNRSSERLHISFLRFFLFCKNKKAVPSCAPNSLDDERFSRPQWIFAPKRRNRRDCQCFVWPFSLLAIIECFQIQLKVIKNSFEMIDTPIRNFNKTPCKYSALLILSPNPPLLKRPEHSRKALND